MKTTAKLLLATVFWLAILTPAPARAGQPAPEFSGTDIFGKSHRLSDYRGKVVVVEAYNFDCPFCANHYKTGSMQALQASAVNRGVVWLLVNSTGKSNPSYRKPDAAQKEWTSLGIKATAWIDDSSGAVGRKLGLKTATHMLVIDAEGTLAYQGAIDDRPANSGDPRTARNYVRQAVEALLAGKPVPVAETKPYGCDIKYGP
jgi:peroxiredoxin